MTPETLYNWMGCLQNRKSELTYFVLQSGWMAVSDRPGLGVELNDEVARSLLWRGDAYFD